jgi:hypothetical protein
MRNGYDEHFPDDYPSYGEHRYGEIGAGIVDALWAVLDILSERLPRNRQYRTQLHNGSISALVEMDRMLGCMRPDERVSIEERDDLGVALRAARTALPITEAEAFWLDWGRLDVVCETTPMTIEQITEHILRQPNYHEGEIVINGMWQAINTQELTDRWTAWREEKGEFSGQGTLDLARESLRTAIHIMEPGRELPDSYRDLRRLS